MFTTRAVLAKSAFAHDTGGVLFEFSKQVLNSGKIVSAEQHLLSVPPCNADGSPIDWNYIRTMVDTGLTELGFGAVSEADWQSVVAFAAANQTPEIVAAAVAVEKATALPLEPQAAKVAT